MDTCRQVEEEIIRGCENLVESSIEIKYNVLKCLMKYANDGIAPMEQCVLDYETMSLGQLLGSMLTIQSFKLAYFRHDDKVVARKSLPRSCKAAASKYIMTRQADPRTQEPDRCAFLIHIGNGTYMKYSANYNGSNTNKQVGNTVS